MVLRSPRARRSEAGLSLLEVLFASVLLLFVLLAISPLFIRSMGSVNEGREASLMSAFGRSILDETQIFDSGHPLMEVPVGSDELVDEFIWDKEHEEWIDPDAPSAPASTQWRLRTRKRVFSLHEVDKHERSQFIEPLDGDIDDLSKHLVELNSFVDNQRTSGAMGAARNMDLTTMRFQ